MGMSAGLLDDIAIVSKAVAVVDAVKRETGYTVPMKYSGNFPIVTLSTQIDIIKHQEDFSKVRRTIRKAIMEEFGNKYFYDKFAPILDRSKFLKYEFNMFTEKDETKLPPILRVTLWSTATCYDPKTKTFRRCYEEEKGNKGTGVCPCGSKTPTNESTLAEWVQKSEDIGE